MTASAARRTFALGGLQGASLNPCTEPGEGIRGYTSITGVAWTDMQSSGARMVLPMGGTGEPGLGKPKTPGPKEGARVRKRKQAGESQGATLRLCAMLEAKV